MTTTTDQRFDNQIWLTMLSNDGLKPEQQSADYHQLCQEGWKHKSGFLTHKTQQQESSELFVDFFQRYFSERKLLVPRELYSSLYKYCGTNSYDIGSPVRCFPLHMTELLAYKLGASTRGQMSGPSYHVVNFRHPIKVEDEHLLLAKMPEAGNEQNNIYLLFIVPWTYEQDDALLGSMTSMHDTQVIYADSYEGLLPKIPPKYRQQLCLDQYH